MSLDATAIACTETGAFVGPHLLAILLTTLFSGFLAGIAALGLFIFYWLGRRS
jgi:hypothetical protein